MTFSHFQPGSRYPGAKFFNAVVDGLNHVDLTARKKEAELRHITVNVANKTGDYLRPFSVVELAALPDELTNLEEIERRLNSGHLFYGIVPVEESDGNWTVAVMTTSLQQDEVGKAVLHGIVTVSVNITDVNHRYARPILGDVDKLESCPASNIKLILKPKKIGEQWADVIMGAGSGGSNTVYIEGEIESEIDGVYTVLPYINAEKEPAEDTIEATTIYLQGNEILENGTIVGVTWTQKYGYRITNCIK